MGEEKKKKSSKKAKKAAAAALAVVDEPDVEAEPVNDDDEVSQEGDAEEAMDAKETAFMEKMLGGKKNLATKLALSAESPTTRRGSILINRRNTASQLAPLQPDFKTPVPEPVAPPSPALGRRELKMRRGSVSQQPSLAVTAAANASKDGASAKKVPEVTTTAAKPDKRMQALDLCARAGLSDFAKLLKAPKEFTRTHAAQAIDSLYQTDSNTVGVEANGFKAFLKLAQSKNSATQCTALWTLTTIAGMAFSGEDEGTQQQLVDEGGLKVAFKLLKSEHAEVPVAAASLIGNMVLLEATRDKLVQKYGLKPLISVATVENLELLRTALVAVANLASEEELLQPIQEAGGIDWLLEHARSKDSASSQAAIAGLANVANSKYQSEVANGGGVSICVPALTSSDPITARAAAQTIANLSQTEANRETILNEALETLIKRATSRDTRVQHNVAVCLLNLAQDEKNRDRIRDAGGEPAVKKLMFSVDEDVREEANNLFQALQTEGSGVIASPRKGAVQALHKKEMTRTASKQFVLGVYEQFKTQKQEDKEMDNIEVLLSKLADYLDGDLPTPDIVCSTIKDVELQAGKSAQNDKLLRDSGGLAMLVSMIPEFETHPNILNQVMSTLHVLVRLNPRNILASSDVDIAVEEFLKCLDNELIAQLNVINLVGALADVQKTRKEIVARGGIEKFVSLLKNVNTATEVQGSTLEVLAKIAIEDPASQQGIEAKVFDVLFEMMERVTSTDVQCQLLRLLSALAFNNRVLQEKVRKTGKLQVALKFLQSHNYLIQEYAVRAMLTLIAGDYKNKDEARKAGAIPALVNLLGSKTDMVVKSAVRGLSELTLAHAKNKTACQKAGALDALAKLVDTSLCGTVEGGAVASKELVMHEMIDCTRTTYALECAAVICSGTPKNQESFATRENITKLVALLDSSDLREVYHAINSLVAVSKNNKKVKKLMHEVVPNLGRLLAQWSKHENKKISVWAAKAAGICN